MRLEYYIEKYGEELGKVKYENYLEYNRQYRLKNKEKCNLRSRKWCEEHKEQHNQLAREWTEEHREQHNATARKYNNKSRQKGSTKFCRVNFDLIENYELAKADNFDKKKWHLHHRLENYWSSDTLIKKGLYFNINPEALIWLPADEHNFDKGMSTNHPELSKWHQRRFERG